MDKIKIYLTSSEFVRTEVKPVTGGDFVWEKEDEEIYYRHLLSEALKFSRKVDYDLIMLLEDDECGEITIEVERKCGDSYQAYWQGSFSLFDCTVNKSRCWIEVRPEPTDNYKCFLDSIDETINTFGGAVVTVTGIFGTIEEQTCTNSSTNADCSEFQMKKQIPDDSCLANPAQWSLKENIVTLNGDVNPPFGCSGTTNNIVQSSTWHREIVTGIPCSGGSPQAPSFGSGWQLLEDDCPGSGTADWWRDPGAGTILGDYTRGRTFQTFMERIMTELGCGLTIKSDFFNINPVGDAPSNGVYVFAQTYLHNLTVHQKSDIKRKDASSGSSLEAWDLKAKDWFDDLRTMFNVRYKIEGSTLIIEHYTFFTYSQGWDLSDVGMNLQFDYSGNENIKRETFYWMDEIVGGGFRSNHITYDCGDDEKENRCTLITTDLEFIENELNSERISDEGFVIISNQLYNSNLTIIDANMPLAWSNLHGSLHRDARLYKSGKLNNMQMDFSSWLPYRKQEPFKTDYCCNQSFNPEEIITTKLGQGLVDSATHNLFTGRIELQLSY